MSNSTSDMVNAITTATRSAVRELFRSFPHEHFYWCALVTTPEAHAPVLCAWSREALTRESAKEPDPREAAWLSKWSYAESPFYCFGAHHFASVEAIFRGRPSAVRSENAAAASEYAARIDAMMHAMATLDREGLFGAGAARLGIVINVTVVPADPTNRERAMQLNPAAALTEWSADGAEI